MLSNRAAMTREVRLDQKLAGVCHNNNNHKMNYKVKRAVSVRLVCVKVLSATLHSTCGIQGLILDV